MGVTIGAGYHMQRVDLPSVSGGGNAAVGYPKSQVK